MVDINYNAFEDQFNKRSTYLYNLSILIRIDRFSYLIEDEHNKLIALRAYRLQSDGPETLKKDVQKVLVEDNILRQPFRSVKIAVANSTQTLVPSVIFDKQYTRKYLEDVTELNVDVEVLKDSIESLDLVNVYALDKEFLQLMGSYFPRASIFHSSTPLFAHLSRQASHLVRQSVFAHVEHENLQLFVFEKERLLFHNQFSFNATNDFLYHILLVYDQLALNPDRIALTLSGDIVKSSNVYKELFKYIRTINFASRPGHYRYDPSLQDIKEHHHYELLSLKLCE